MPSPAHDHLLAADAADSAASLVAGPGRVDALAGPRVELPHHETHGGADPPDLAAEERQVAGPEEIVVAAADEVRVVDVVPGIAGRMERLDDDPRRPRIVEADPQPRDDALPSRQAVHGDHGAGLAAGDSILPSFPPMGR